MIDNDDVVLLQTGIEPGERGVSVFDAGEVVARSGEDVAKGEDDRWLIIDGQDPESGCAHEAVKAAATVPKRVISAEGLRRRQKTEVRRQRSEVGEQRTENREQRTENRKQNQRTSNAERPTSNVEVGMRKRGRQGNCGMES